MSTTIDKYCYISLRYLPPFFPHKHRIVYSKIEMVKDVNEIMHPSVRATLDYLQISDGMEIHHDGDLPAMTGLGTSSAFTVGILNSLYALKGLMPSKTKLANEAIYIERDVLEENVGIQDQIAVSHGGFNKIIFSSDGEFRVEPITISKEKIKELDGNLMLFFTGISRFASDVAKSQIENTPNKQKELSLMGQMVDRAVEILNSNIDISEFGKLLNETWQLKKSLSNKISNPEVDDIYVKALRAGALGGKLTGAGGGGFLLLYVPREAQDRVRNALKGLLEVPFTFETSGSQIIHYNQS